MAAVDETGPTPPLGTRVWEILRRDGIALEAMSRGIVNQRALSRWLIQMHGIDATEDAVLAAIRRGRSESAGVSFRQAYEVLGRCHVNVRTRIGEVVAPRTSEVQSKIPRIFNQIDFSRGEVFYLSEGEAGIRLAVDENRLSTVIDALAPLRPKVRRNLAAMIIVWPPDADVPGPSALISMSLALAGINVWAAVDADPDSAIFVDDADAQKAFRVLDDLFRRHADNGR